jgi:2-methylisocitrate lyase-like PEP mutase family enzyme
MTTNDAIGAKALSLKAAYEAPQITRLVNVWAEGVARISYGPLPQREALRALRDLATDLYAEGVISADLPALN